jgi:proteic killer suppression protein
MIAAAFASMPCPGPRTPRSSGWRARLQGVSSAFSSAEALAPSRIPWKPIPWPRTGRFSPSSTAPPSPGLLHGYRVSGKMTDGDRFGDQATADLYHGARTRRVRVPPDVVPGAHRKLDMLDAAQALRDLRSPPGNRLERLRGKWRGFHSIRCNEQWRIVFRWTEGQSNDVRLVDYHRG